ncbi:MAG: hypothetical protein H0U74_13585 [Bradymonadaceae bacterium]|nr:hypothetical protein [Lujinxingiaceae bacterium]
MAHASLLVVLMFLGACAGPQPRFSADVQRSFVDNAMRRLETERLVVYYPEQRREQAEQFASRLELCVEELDKWRVGSDVREKIPVIMPEVEFNNAYVTFGSGGNPPHMVVPTFFTADLFTQIGMPPSAAFISCHEAVHYVQVTEINGIPWLINTVLGHVYTPQMGLDFWFWEGLATYYESQLNPGIGRMASPFWHQSFASGAAQQRLDGGTMHFANRQIPFGGHYLVGSHFIKFLAERYGQQRLWQVIDRQSRAVLIPFGVNPRFHGVYGKSLSTLIDEFAAHTAQTYPTRVRPGAQQVVRDAGLHAQWAVAADGTQAQIWQDLDRPQRLSVWAADGRLIYERAFPDILPPRKLVVSGLYSGLSFSANAGELYFTAFDLDEIATQTRLIRLELATGNFEIVHADIRGAGGSITPDGRRYVFPHADGDRHHLAAVNLTTRQIELLHTMPAGAYVAFPRVSPDGSRIAAVVLEGAQAGLWVFSAATGAVLARLGDAGDIHREPSWLDNEHLLVSAEVDGRFQVFAYHSGGGQRVQLSEAPYLAVQPFATSAGRVGFLNRQGWGWTIDTIERGALPLATPAVAVNVPEPASDSPSWGSDAQAKTPAAIAGLPTLVPTRVFDDRPYSKLDGLFIPRLHAPSFVLSADRSELALQIGGLDTLGFHSWGIAFAFEFVNSLPSFAVGYVNAQLAPWYLFFGALQSWMFEPYVVLDEEGKRVDRERLDRRERVGSVHAARTFYDIPLVLGFLANELYRPQLELRRFLGPQLATRFAAGRGAPYSGTLNLFALGLSASFYPAQLGSDFSLGDVRTESSVHLPLPLSRRHRLRLNARARSLLGVPEGISLMRVGGIAHGPLLAERGARDAPFEPIADILPSAIGFSESLRGYEDFGIATNQVLAFETDYRYPIIIDRGSASSLYLLPATFFRQINFELFATTAVTTFDGRYHAAAGASVDFNVLFWLIPFQLRYQAAQRLVDDRALVHTLTLGLGLD